MTEPHGDWKFNISDLQNVRHKGREKMPPDDVKGTTGSFGGNGRDAEISRNKEGHFAAVLSKTECLGRFAGNKTSANGQNRQLSRAEISMEPVKEAG